MSRTRRKTASHNRRGRPPRVEREARLASRRAELLAAAVSAIERDGASATMTRMAAEAGVTKPVLYRYFGDRAGLYEAIAAQFAAGLLAEVRTAIRREAPGRATVEAGVDAYLAHLERHPTMYRFVTTRAVAVGSRGPQRVQAFLRAVDDELAELLRPALTTAPADGGDVEVIASGLTGMCHAVGERWLANGARDRARVVAVVVDVLWDGLATKLREPSRDLDVEGAGGAATEGI